MVDLMPNGEFSVCQFFIDGQYEYVRRYVSAEEAMRAFIRYTTNVATMLGVVERVILTDGGDFTTMEWKKGEGITYPPEAVGKILRPDWEDRLKSPGD
jgi:hypothetical protein